MRLGTLVSFLLVFAFAGTLPANVTVNSDSFHYGFDASTNASSVTSSDAFATDFDEGTWYVGTDGSGTSQRWYIRQTSFVLLSVAEMNKWELTFNLAPNREITSVSIDVMAWQIGTSTVASNYKMGFGYVDSLDQYVILKELLGVSNSAKSTTYNGYLLPADVEGMTSVTVFGYVQARNFDANNVAGQLFQFARGSATAGEKLQITINTKVVPYEADLNEDFVVNLVDLSLFSAQWLDTLIVDPNGPDPNGPTPDFNGDTHVDLQDFEIINRDWLKPQPE